MPVLRRGDAAMATLALNEHTESRVQNPTIPVPEYSADQFHFPNLLSFSLTSSSFAQRIEIT